MPMKDPKSLQAFRKEIDKIDDEIIRLLNARARHVIEIGKLKKAQDSQANLHTPAREAEILDRLCKNNPGPFPTDGLRAVYREIMSGSLALEGPLRSEEHTSELQSPCNLVCRLLLEKKKNVKHEKDPALTRGPDTHRTSAL